MGLEQTDGEGNSGRIRNGPTVYNKYRVTLFARIIEQVAGTTEPFLDVWYRYRLQVKLTFHGLQRCVLEFILSLTADSCVGAARCVV